MDYDVVVVGCGVAGLSAALSAAENGAKVAILERSTKEVRGGNSRYTEAYCRISSETQISDDFIDRFSNNAVGTIDPALLQSTIKPYDQWPQMLKGYPLTDPELIRVFAEGVPEGIRWLKGYGVRFLETTPFLTQVTKRWAPSGGGEAIVETLAPAAEKRGIPFYYETTARSLIQNSRGDVRGVNVWSNKEGNGSIEAKAVVLACGGFEGNLEMMIRYVGTNAYLTRPVAPGGLYNKGEGIEMALAIGAAPAGQYDDFHAEPIDPRSGRPASAILHFAYGIIVNQLGNRFVDEGAGFSDLIYEGIARRILRQPGGKAYCIHDSKIEDVTNYKKAARTDKGPITGKSIKELAAKIEVNPSNLETTIRRYNEAVQDGSFKPFALDGKCTKGIEPPKSNWARTIDENDLQAYPMICSTVLTFGALKVSPAAEVVNRDGYPIPGLYAAGETVGLYYGPYVGSTSVLKGLVFGRLAGTSSAHYGQKKK
jgi:tricarballylate dehydrogenase